MQKFSNTKYIIRFWWLTVDSLIETNNIITHSNKITLRKVNVKQYRFDKMYIDKELI